MAGDGGIRERFGRWVAAHAEPIAAGALVAAGWLLILAINRWHLGAPAVFLCLGWLSIVAAGRLLWVAAVRAGTEQEGVVDEVEPIDRSRLVELEREKRTLLKAIKEVEFDRELGKMSEEDASEIVRVYRARAIEILKVLDGAAADGDGAVAAPAPDEPLDQLIEREVRARLALAGVKSRARKPEARPADEDGASEP